MCALAPELLNVNVTNWSYIKYELRKLGYVTKGQLKQSRKLGTKLDRNRAWALALKYGSLLNSEGKPLTAEEGEDLLDAILQLWNKLEIEAPDLEESLLCNSHPWVRSEFNRLLENKQDDVEHCDWPNLHRKTLKEAGLTPATWEMTNSITSAWLQLLSKRENQCLALAMELHEKRDEALTSVDVYQSINRLFIGLDGCLGPMLPGARCWLMDEERFMIGSEALVTQCYPMSLLLKWSKAFKKDFCQILMKNMAGNMYTGSVYFSLLLCVFALLPGVAGVDDDQSDEESVCGEALLRLCQP